MALFGLEMRGSKPGQLFSDDGNPFIIKRLKEISREAEMSITDYIYLLMKVVRKVDYQKDKTKKVGDYLTRYMLSEPDIQRP